MAGKSTSQPKVRGARKVPVVSITVAVGGLVLAVAATLLWVLPTTGDVTATTAAIAQVQSSTATSTARIAALKGGQSSGAQELLDQARVLDAQLPSSVDKVTLVAEIPTTAAAYGLSVTKMDPQAEDGGAGGGVSAMKFDVGVSGENSQVLAFIDKLTAEGQSARLIVVSDVVLSVSDGQTTATFTLSAYYSGQPAIDESRTTS